MGLGNTREGWGWLARLLHWAMAGLILFMSGLGLYMTEFFAPGDMSAYPWFQMHKSWGFVVFALVALRLLWRLVNPTPDEVPGQPGWAVRLARVTHVGLYLLMIAVPVSGWLMISASPLQDLGVPNRVFGLFDFPDPFVPGDGFLSERLKQVHGTLWMALGILAALHVVGAVKHHVIDRDAVLRRMILGR
jgi:cytochrome b561